ncbi:MAG: hypothetical protein RL297_1073 [Pseudomonadota bacterium]|jgi:hypothetical protein
MNDNRTHTTDPDHALRQILRDSQAPVPDSQDLQQRVLAQWLQRHPQQPHDHPTLLSNASVLLLGQTQRLKMAFVLLTISLTVLLVFWWTRPDPILQELLQPDVLSLMGMGEM